MLSALTNLATTNATAIDDYLGVVIESISDIATNSLNVVCGDATGNSTVDTLCAFAAQSIDDVVDTATDAVNDAIDTATDAINEATNGALEEMVKFGASEILNTIGMHTLAAVGGSFAPAARIIQLQGVNPDVVAVKKVTMSAPLVGFGASLGDSASTTARTVPGDPELQPISTCATYGYPHYEVTNSGVDSPFYRAA